MTICCAAILVGISATSALPERALAVPNPRILVFSKTAGFRHDSIPYALGKLREIADKHKWTLTATEDAAAFDKPIEGQYDVLLFLSTTGDILNATQQATVERFVKAGRGFVGIHAAADTEYDWPWYGELVGAYFKRHPAIQPATIDIHEHAHPASNFLPDQWKRTDEWYCYKANPPRDANVLMTLDEASYQGGSMGDFHPITWCREFAGGRTFYTGFGHTKESYDEPEVQRVIQEAVLWSAQAQRPASAKTLVMLGDYSKWERDVKVTGNGRELKAEAGGNAMATERGGANLTSRAAHGDCYLHVEFMVPEGGNAGVYLQSRYEIQILDSGHLKASELDGSTCGGLYPQWINERNENGVAPKVQAAGDPGQWQTLDILFQAPRFGRSGKRTQPALFREVRLNGVVIHENVQAVGPTRGGLTPEVARGPLKLQGDHGGIAYRNLWMVE